MRHRRPLFLTTHLVRPFNKEEPALPVPIGIWHIGHQLQVLLLDGKMVCTFGGRYVMRPVIVKELVQRELTVPSTKPSPQYLCSNKSPSSVGSNLVDGQT